MIQLCKISNLFISVRYNVLSDMQNDYLMTYFLRADIRDISNNKYWVEMASERNMKNGPESYYAILYKQKYIGEVAIDRYKSCKNSYNVFYWLHPHFRGKKMSLIALLNLYSMVKSFSLEKRGYLELRVDHNNTSSLAIAEKASKIINKGLLDDFFKIKTDDYIIYKLFL